MTGLLSAALVLSFSGPAAAGPPAINEVCAQIDDVVRSTITAPAPDISSWLIKVEPGWIFGTGHGGAGEDDIDRPDGLTYTRDGLLLATDAGNKRIKALADQLNYRVAIYRWSEVAKARGLRSRE